MSQTGLRKGAESTIIERILDRKRVEDAEVDAEVREMGELLSPQK